MQSLPSKAPAGSKMDMFLIHFKEDADHNQYWYSKTTASFMVDQVEAHCKVKAAFVSTPSIYFALKSAEVRERSVILDYDERFKAKAAKLGGESIFYDFNDSLNIPEKYHHAFDFVVIDPPFITEEVWSKVGNFAYFYQYAESAKLLMKEDAKLLVSTIDQNEAMMGELLNLQKRRFRPSIPNLVYQYSFYSNYEDPALDEPNPEIPE